MLLQLLEMSNRKCVVSQLLVDESTNDPSSNSLIPSKVFHSLLDPHLFKSFELEDFDEKNDADIVKRSFAMVH